MKHPWIKKWETAGIALVFLLLTACQGQGTDTDPATAFPGTVAPASAEITTGSPAFTDFLNSSAVTKEEPSASEFISVTQTAAASTVPETTVPPVTTPDTITTGTPETTKAPSTTNSPETTKIPETTKTPETTVPNLPKVRVPLTDSSSVITLMEDVMSNNLGVGMQAAVFSGGVLTAEYAAGLAIWDSSHPKNNVPMTTSHLIRCASLSKTVLAICAARMTELGMLDLDAPIGTTYWGQKFPVEFSMQDILTHTSPIYNMEDYYKSSTSATLALLLNRNNYRFSETGKYYSYNNYAVGIGGATIELILGGSTQAFMENYFYRDMQSEATWFPGDRQTGTYAYLYSYGTWLAMDLDDIKDRKDLGAGANSWVYAGGVFTSAGDLAKMYAMLANDGVYAGKRYLEADTVAMMETSRRSVTEDGITFDQCLILRHRENIYGQEELFYHTGSAFGVHAVAMYNPITTQGVVILTNGSGTRKDDNHIYSVCSLVAEALLNGEYFK